MASDSENRKSLGEHGESAQGTKLHWSDIFQQVEWGVVIGSGDGQTLLMMNPAYARMHGYTIEELTGRPIAEVFAPETRADLAKQIRITFEQGHNTYESIHLRRDGTRFPVLVQSTAIKDAEGRVLCLAAHVQDITERKRIEEELSRSEEKYRSLLENANDIIYSHDLQGNYLTINRAGERSTGYTREEILGGLNISQVVAPEHLELAKEMTARKLQDPTPTVYEVDIIARDGRRLTLELSTRVSYRDGQPIAVEGIARDVTERRKAQEHVRLSEERFRLAASSEALTLFEQDMDLRYVWVFPQHPEFPEGNIGRTDAELLPPQDAEVLMQFKRQVLETGAGLRREVKVTLPDEVHWYDMVVEPRRDSTGAIIGVAGVTLDITARKHAEAERERLLVSERTARREAEEAGRLKDEFLATVSHELRTPLTAILGWSKMLLSGTLDQETGRRAMGIIERNARSQAQLIEDILDVSRIITGKLRLDVRPVRLVNVIEAAIDAARPAAEGKEITLEAILDQKAGFVPGDADRLQQVVWNLLSNAVKFTDRGGRVCITLRRADSHLEVVVSDNGCGIKPEFLPSVFERFRQQDGTTTRSHGGLGLGLAIVRHLVELHGGTVLAESLGEGRGATFTVSLPLIYTGTEAASHGLGHAAVIEQSGMSFDCPPRLEGLEVLVVEDEADTRELLARILSECGAQVRQAASVAEALDQFERRPPDVLLSDIGMPGQDGYQLISKVRALSRQEGGAVPAAALTAYAKTEDRVKVIAAGYQVHIPKPVEPLELVTIIASLARRALRS